MRTVDADAYSNGTCNIKMQRHVYGEVPYKKVLYLGVRDEAHHYSLKKKEINTRQERMSRVCLQFVVY